LAENHNFNTSDPKTKEIRYVYQGDYVIRVKNSSEFVRKLYEDEHYHSLNIDEKIEIARTISEAKETISVSNGEFGYVLGKCENELIIGYVNAKYYDSTPVIEYVYSETFFDSFKLAYSLSAHKYQGSEFSTSIINLTDNYNLTIDGGKNILYTSVTRAKELLIICGKANDKRKFHDTLLQKFANPIHDLENPCKITKKAPCHGIDTEYL
jgi:ATP-dependent exoDNAse (exonuclease V) alpha subunit